MDFVTVSTVLASPYWMGDSGNLKITNLDRLIFTKNGEFANQWSFII